ncbi:MAG: T9SS type A sorting domain-containing protein [Bacteroidetes bacterium]|nr:T9SS type A sorting domain-containing protein [Bacteroidota bacterium]HET6245034.1 PA domain-containing protein [Bacteroidia bacterium]
MKRKILLILSLFAGIMINNHANAQIVFLVETPSSVAGSYGFTYSSDNNWGADINTSAVSAPVVVINDSLACTPAVNPTAINGNIAMVYRGSCMFSLKAYHAQQAGAVAVIIVNNKPGEGLFGMLAGDSASAVTIPVILISYEDGAFLRSAIDAGTLNAFIGNKSGLYPSDMGFYNGDIVVASGAAIPQVLASDSNSFSIPVGAWVTNFGSDNQTNATLNAEIKHENVSIYSQSMSVTLLSGADIFVALPKFAQASYPIGSYTLTYTISPTVADGYPADNQIITYFQITESKYSKVRLDPNTLLPIKTGSTRAAGAYAEFTWCSSMKVKNAGNAKVHGFSFSATRENSSLADKTVLCKMYEWNNKNLSNFDSISEVGSKLYDYLGNYQDSVVSAYFENNQEELEPITLKSNQLYLACITVFDDSINLGYSSSIDYLSNTVLHDDAFSPVAIKELPGQANPTWYNSGFGTEMAPGLTIEFGPSTVGIKENKISTFEQMPYPNPTNNYISIPLKGDYAGMVELLVIDITGKIVKSERINISNSTILNVNTSDINSGTYFFQVKSENKKTLSFPVVIAK